MNILVVYCHPSKNSFTAKVLQSFLRGLTEAGHKYIISDLYEMNFHTDLTLEEYNREGYYRENLPVPQDVLSEQQKINKSDGIAFIYPVWWADCPAKLKGWFDRVLTVGFAYASNHNTCKVLEKALFLCTAGNSTERLEEQGVAQSMKIVSLNDRINTRAKLSNMVILGGQVEQDPIKIEKNLHLAFEEGKNF